MNRKQRELLSEWSNALKKLNRLDWAKRGFNMGYWARHKLPETPNLGCGTVCCAYGVGTTLPEWKKAGLCLVERDISTEDDLHYEPIAKAYEILGLSSEEWDYIVDPWSLVEESPLEVAKKIDMVLLRSCETGKERYDGEHYRS